MRPKDVIAELLGIAGRETLGVDFHEGRLREKSVRAILLLHQLLLSSYEGLMIYLDEPFVPLGDGGFIIASLLL